MGEMLCRDCGMSINEEMPLSKARHNSRLSCIRALKGDNDRLREINAKGVLNRIDIEGQFSELRTRAELADRALRAETSCHDEECDCISCEYLGVNGAEGEPRSEIDKFDTWWDRFKESLAIRDRSRAAAWGAWCGSRALASTAPGGGEEGP